MEKVKFTVACKKYFGKKDGQTLLGFAQEIRLLTPEDKTELIPLLSKELGQEVEL